VVKGKKYDEKVSSTWIWLLGSFFGGFSVYRENIKEYFGLTVKMEEIYIPKNMIKRRRRKNELGLNFKKICFRIVEVRS